MGVEVKVGDRQPVPQMLNSLWPFLENASRDCPGPVGLRAGPALFSISPSPTFVSFRGPVLAVAMGSNSEYCYSGGADARIHSWRVPDLGMDPYDGYGEDSSLPCLPFPHSCQGGPLPTPNPAPRALCLGVRRAASFHPGLSRMRREWWWCGRLAQRSWWLS